MWIVGKKPRDLDIGAQDIGFLGDGSLHIAYVDTGTGIKNRRQIYTTGAMTLPIQYLQTQIPEGYNGQIATIGTISNPMTNSIEDTNPFLTS